MKALNNKNLHMVVFCSLVLFIALFVSVVDKANVYAEDAPVLRLSTDSEESLADYKAEYSYSLNGEHRSHEVTTDIVAELSQDRYGRFSFNITGNNLNNIEALDINGIKIKIDTSNPRFQYTFDLEELAYIGVEAQQGEIGFSNTVISFSFEKVVFSRDLNVSVQFQPYTPKYTPAIIVDDNGNDKNSISQHFIMDAPDGSLYKMGDQSRSGLWTVSFFGYGAG